MSDEYYMTKEEHVYDKSVYGGRKLRRCPICGELYPEGEYIIDASCKFPSFLFFVSFKGDIEKMKTARQRRCQEDKTVGRR